MKIEEIQSVDDFISYAGDKVNVDEATIKKDYEDIYASLGALTSLSEPEKKMRTIKLLITKYKKLLMRGQSLYEAIVLALSEPRDINEKRYKEAIQAYQRDKEKAIQDGITDENGIPIDRVEFFASGSKNFNFGKPLGKKYLINAVALVRKVGDTDFRYAYFTVNEDKMPENLRCFSPIAFPAAAGKPREDWMVLNLQSPVQIQKSDFVKMDDDAIENLMKKYVPAKFMVKPEGVEDWFIRNIETKNLPGKFDNTIIFVKGDVYRMRLEPTSNNTRILELNIESDFVGTEDIQESLACFVPMHIDLVDMAFGEGSTVIVAGRPSRGKAREGEERGRVTLNAAGVYVIPKFKMPAKVVMKKEDVKVELPKPVEAEPEQAGW